MASAASPQTPSGGAGKLESLSKEDLIKFAKRQTMLLSKAKEKITGMYELNGVTVMYCILYMYYYIFVIIYIIFLVRYGNYPK